MAQVKPLKLLDDGNFAQVDPTSDDLTSNTLTSTQLNITNGGDTVASIDGLGNAVFNDLSVKGVETVIGTITANTDLTLTGSLTVSGNVFLGESPEDNISFKGTSDTHLNMGSNKIVNLSDPTNPTDAATMRFVLNNASATAWSRGGDTIENGEKFGSLNSADVTFVRDDTEYMRLSDNGTKEVSFFEHGTIGFGDSPISGFPETLIINSKNVDFGSTDSSKSINIYTGNTNQGNSGFLEIGTGSPSTGNSGNLLLFTGTPENGGIRGIISINAPEILVTEATVYPAIDNTNNLGKSTERWKNVFAVNVNTSNLMFDDQVKAELNEASINTKVDIVPDQDNSLNLGSAGFDFKNVFTKKLGTTTNDDLSLIHNNIEVLRVTSNSVYLDKDLDMSNHKIMNLGNPTESGDGSNKEYVDTAITTALGTLGKLTLPTDGVYGGSNGNISGVSQTDRYEDAFDKVEVILGKLAPAKPANLSAKTLTIVGTYSAYESDSGATPTLRTNVIDDTAPLAQTPSGLTNGFWDGEEGTLTAQIDLDNAGTLSLSTDNDSGIYSSLQVISDYDFYAGQAGKELFWKALIAGVKSESALSLGAHTYRLVHSKTGGTPLLTFYVDDPQAVMITGQTIVGSGIGRYVSGVPSLNTGDLINASFMVNNAIRHHYNSTRIASATSTLTNTVNQALPSIAPTIGATYAGSIALSVQASKYGETTTVSCSGFNSKGISASANAVANIRVDTFSSEVRVKSGQGQYPAFGTELAQYGGTFDSTKSLVDNGNEELQLLNGIYQFPTGNYTNNLPVAGPNYSLASGGSFNNYRWVTFNLGSKLEVSSVTLNINGGANLGSTTLIAGLALYLKVDGAIPTNGWLDGNAAYGGVGNPTNNGDAALNFGSSSVTTKVITFGANVRTGNVYVRVGIPLASTKRFTTITIA